MAELKALSRLGKMWKLRKSQQLATLNTIREQAIYVEFYVAWD